MAVKYEIYLSDCDHDRLLSEKKKNNLNHMTCNEYASEILSAVLRARCPNVSDVEE